MPSLPLVSIVLPTFNGARWLDGAIDSCARQTYQNWELIVVDDASTDTTPQIIEEWQRRDSRIRGVRNAANRRVPGSLNRGFAEARGSYLTWTSDDNLFRPQAIGAMAEFLDGNAEVGLVYTDLTFIDDSGRPTSSMRVPDPGALAFTNSVMACFMYRRGVYEQVGDYDAGFELVEDWDYWLRALEHFRLAPLHRDLYQYRFHEGSLTSTKRQRVDEQIERLLAYYLASHRTFSRHERSLGYQRLAARPSIRSRPTLRWAFLWKAMINDPFRFLPGRRRRVRVTGQLAAQVEG